MIAKIFKTGNSMALRLPKLLNPKEGVVSIEAEGSRWIVEPVKPKKWPRGFFKKIRIKDSAFARPKQGKHRSIAL
jgi:virulence-associated protein VagC